MIIPLFNEFFFSLFIGAGGPDSEKEAVPLVDYIHNVMKFVDAILSNNATDDHCREFVLQKGLEPLMGILGLPNLPIDFPTHAACQAVSAVSKSILNLAHEPQVLKSGLSCLNDVLKNLEPLHKPLDPPGIVYFAFYPKYFRRLIKGQQ